MANLRNIFGGLLVLTVTALLTRPAEAANCATDGDCQNSGTCPDPTAACDCSASAYVGDTCNTEVCTEGGDECQNGGTCDTTASPKVCKCDAYKGKTCDVVCTVDSDCANGGTCSNAKICVCGDYKGTHCADECDGNDDCGTEGTCGEVSPKKCTCKDTSKTGPGCTISKSGASTVVSFSLMSLFVILTGFCL